MARDQHIPIPRYKPHAGAALFAQGFRPFFLAAAIWAVLALAFSIAMIRGRITLPTAFDPVTWHYHELLYGYVAATIAGFLLTAIPNWTGRLPLQGGPLAAMVLLWLAGRVAIATSALVGTEVAALVDLAFLAVLALVALREIIAGKNWRNLVPIAGILLLLVGNALLHAETIAGIESDGASRRLPIAIVIMMISLIGGRVVPSFTRNWLVKRGVDRLPAGFSTFDRMALALSLMSFGGWVLWPDSAIVAGALGCAGLVQLIRLARWRGWATRGEPLLLVLHVAYLWIPVGLILLSASHWSAALSTTGAVHALTAGAMGTMTLAVMSRAILGHTGRALHAGVGLSAVYLLITVATASRIAATLTDGLYMIWVITAAGAWIASFLVFLAVCGPMLLRPRNDR